MPACPSSLLDASYTHLPGAVAGLGSAARCKRGIAKHGREGANIGGRTRGGAIRCVPAAAVAAARQAAGVSRRSELPIPFASRPDQGIGRGALSQQSQPSMQRSASAVSQRRIDPDIA